MNPPDKKPQVRTPHVTPVYRAQSTPKVLQAKTHGRPITSPAVPNGPHSTRTESSAKRPTAPPVYRPSFAPRMLQLKRLAVQHPTSPQPSSPIQAKLHQASNLNVKTSARPGYLPLQSNVSSEVIQRAEHQHADSMRKRRRFKRSLKTAIRRIQALGGGPRANLAQINIHDEVLHAGQHHGMRNVSLTDLIKDLTDKIAEMTNLNLGESDQPA